MQTTVRFKQTTITFVDTTVDFVDRNFPKAINEIDTSNCFLSIEDGKLIMSFKNSSPFVWNGEKWVEYE